MTKKVSFARVSPKAADDWVAAAGTETAAALSPPPEPAEPMKRLTIDIPRSLHTRIKAACALRGSKMADEIRALLDREYDDTELRRIVKS
jgi:ParG